MAKPTDKTFLDVSTQAYSKNPASKLDGFALLRRTTTINAYINEDQKVIIIGVRGTEVKDPGDLKADASLPFNRLTTQARYQRDKAFTAGVLRDYPGYQVFLTGHSLGGAIDNQLKRDFPQLRDAVEFNPAFQTRDLLAQQPGIKRFYISNDPLYRLGGRLFRGNVVLPPGASTGIDLIDSLRGHKLSQFSTPITARPAITGSVGGGNALVGSG